jgi:hypothetical protein
METVKDHSCGEIKQSNDGPPPLPADVAGCCCGSTAPLLGAASKNVLSDRDRTPFDSGGGDDGVGEPVLQSALFSELRRLGYVEGQNLVVERRTAEGRTERFPEFAREVVHRRPDVILANSSRLIQHLRTATTTIPIVGITGDPIAAGIVGNLARPGGNITGFVATPGDEIYAKYVEL